MFHTPKSGPLRAVTALLTGGALALAGASVALAADGNPATIDSTKTASLTVHKYEQPTTATGLAHDGTELDAADLTGLTALLGVEFTVQKVPGVDLTTNAGWATATAMTTAAAKAAVAGVTGTALTTDANGVAAFTGLDLGLYYVSETATPSGVVAGAPFLVTLPLTDPTDSASWLYDVHVYPKNFSAGTDKTVEDLDAVKIGDQVTWTISSTIPMEATDGFQMTDTLDDKLRYASVSVKVDGTALVPTTDYTVTPATAPTAGGGTVSVVLTAAGLVKVNAALGKTISFDLVTEVLAVGEIANVAEIYNNQADIDSGTPSDYTPGHPEDPDVDPTDPTGPVAPVTKFGAVTLLKVDATDATTLLAGATFQVYTSEADAKAGTNPVTISGTSSWSTDASGTLTISGLRYSNWENNAEITNVADYRNYWLVETVAPAGYELLAAPVEFSVLGNDTVVDYTVNNSPADAGFTLPLTGGTGIALLMIGGVALVGGAVMIGTRRRRTPAAA